METLFAEIPRELKRLINEAADRHKMTITEFVAKALAREVGHPELGESVRRWGRPRKDLNGAK